MPVETEIRLAATATAMTRATGAAALARLAASRPVTEPLAAVYWDTPSMALREAGIALRLRRHGDGRVTQTLKLASGDPFRRNEFEAPARDHRPHFDLALAQGWRPARALQDAEPQLRPTFATEFTRAARTLTFADGTIAELAFDRGRIRGGPGHDRSLPIREIEIELLDGDVRRIHELAAELVREIAGLSLQFVSKAERGYQLVTGLAMPPRRARDVPLASKERATRLAVASVAEALSHVADNIAGARSVDDPEYVHQMRVGVRRLRVANVLARGAGLPIFSPRLTGELKWLWGLLGAARDWDVFATVVWPAAKALADAASDTAGVDARIARARARAQRALRGALDGPRFQRMMLAIPWILAHQRAEANVQRDAARTATSLSRKLLRKRHARVMRSGAAWGDLTPAQRHRLRIDAKKLRYLAEFGAALYPQRAARRYLRRLAKLQGALGGLNDLAASRALLKQAVHADARERSDASVLLTRYAAGHSGALERDLARAWRKLARVPAFWT